MFFFLFTISQLDSKYPLYYVVVLYTYYCTVLQYTEQRMAIPEPQEPPT